MEIPVRLMGILPMADLFSWPVTLLLKECLIRQYIHATRGCDPRVVGQVARILAFIKEKPVPHYL